MNKLEIGAIVLTGGGSLYNIVGEVAALSANNTNSELAYALTTIMSVGSLLAVLKYRSGLRGNSEMPQELAEAFNRPFNLSNEKQIIAGLMADPQALGDGAKIDVPNVGEITIEPKNNSNS